MSINGDSAYGYTQRGWAVLPLEQRGKKPIIAGGCTNASTDPDQVRACWEQLPNSNIGIATGSKSGGLVVIDLDVDESKGEDGKETLHEWEREHGELPETVTAITGSDGYHMLYMVDTEVRNSANAELGVDIRGEGGYFVAPPSIHPNGTPYFWENDPSEYDVAQADANVMAFIQHVQPRQSQGGEFVKFELPDEIKSGGRNDTMHRYASSLQSRGVADADIMMLVKSHNAQLCKPPLPDAEVEQLVLNVINRYGKGQKSELAKKQDAQPEPVKNAAERVQLDGTVQKTKGGALVGSVYNVMQLIRRADRLDGHFYLDTFADRRMAVLPLPWDESKGEHDSGERAVKDDDYNMLQIYFEQNGVTIADSKKTVQALQAYCFLNQRNPVTDYLDALQWDGRPRVGTLLACSLGCEPNEYYDEVMRLFMSGAVARAYNPGTKFDYVPILHGKQGLGKSHFLSQLCPNNLWFDDNFNDIKKEPANRLQGKWILELAELLALQGAASDELVKGFVTSTADNWRKPFGREITTRARRCVFAGTTNKSSFLTDPTGNRRFLPVECGIYPPTLDAWSDDYPLYIAQCWAEVVDAYKRGEAKLVLSEESERYADMLRGIYTEDDPRVGIIQQYLNDRHGRGQLEKGTANKMRVCVTELCRFMDIKDDRETVNEIHEIMHHKIHGWYPYPTKQHKARCGDYGVQLCYIPAEAFDKPYPTVAEWE